MATTKVTVTLPKDQVAMVKALIGSGAAGKVSDFVKRAVDVAIRNSALWRATLNEALEQTGGPLTDKECAWVDSLLGKRPAKKRAAKRKAA